MCTSLRVRTSDARRAAALAVCLLALAGGAHAATKPAASEAAARKAPSTRVASAPLTISPSDKVVPFIADDYTRAVAEARARKVPLFIEAWAPW